MKCKEQRNAITVRMFLPGGLWYRIAEIYYGGVTTMANLQIKGIREELYAQIKQLAAGENRSVAQQILFLAKDYLAKKEHLSRRCPPAQVLLELWGSWDDDREPEEVVSEVKSARRNSTRLSEGL